jgi:hypothetical protein
MAAVTLYGSGSSVTTTNNSNRSVTISPAVDDLIVCVCFATGQTDWTNVTLTDDQGGTYTRLTGASAIFGVSTNMIAVWVRNSLVSTTSSHVITLDFTTGSVGHSGAGLVAHKVTGMSRSGTSAILQAAKVDNGTNSTTPTVTLGSAASTSNALIGAVANVSNPAALTPPSSWTELLDTGFTSPTSGLETVSRDSGETASSIAWGNISSRYGAAIVELDITSPPAATPRSLVMMF